MTTDRNVSIAHALSHVPRMEEVLGSLGMEGAQAVAGALSDKAENYTNDPMIEQLWAMKAIKYAETHMKLLRSCDAKGLSLTKYDSQMYEEFQKQFSDLQVAVVSEDKLKTKEAKELWRPFCNRYEKLVVDYSYATLLRLDASKDYSEENTTIVPRVQFLVIEVVRNRLGYNSKHYSKQPL